MRLRILACLATGLLACIDAVAQAPAAAPEESSVGLYFVETPDLKLVYFDHLGFMAPYAVRTFTNSLAWQRQRFGWKPTEASTVLLKDFSDYGSAAAWAAPRNTLFVDVAPLSLAFETYPAAERMYSLMNHELVHVASNDVANEQDRRWRRFFRGKVAPHTGNPESLLYGYLTVPRFTAPRWWLEGSAVFMETWMGGGLGRAQGGYDEMVFRAMVRDNAPFFDPLGLESRGVRVDFQVGANAYLYGTRFMTWLALTLLARASGRLDAPRRGQQAPVLATSSSTCSACRWRRAGSTGSPSSATSSAATSSACASSRSRRTRYLAQTALGSISRMAYDEKTATLYGAFRYQGFVEHVGAIDTRTGTVRRLADIKQAMLYRVVSFAFDPTRAPPSTPTTTSPGATSWRSTSTPAPCGCCSRTRASASSPSTAATVALRRAPPRRLATLVRVPPPYTAGWQNLVTLSVRPWCRTTSTSRPTASCCRRR